MTGLVRTCKISLPHRLRSEEPALLRSLTGVWSSGRRTELFAFLQRFNDPTGGILASPNGMITMIDYFADFTDSAMAPAMRCFAIAPSDTTDLPVITKALYIGEAGNVTLRSLKSDADVTFYNLPAGSILDVRTKAVRSTGTTAASLVGLA